MRKVLLGLLGLLALLAVPVALGVSGAAWTSRAPAPAPRQEVSYVALGDKLYLAAGNDRSQQRYDPASDSWSPAGELPAGFEGLDHVQAVAVGERIVYAGGLEQWEYPFPVSGAVALYDPGSGFASGTSLPSPRAAGGAASWNGKLIYAGGLGPSGSVSRVDAYDPQSGEWTQLAEMPRARDHFQAAVVGDRLYAIGGRNTYDGGDGQIALDEIAAVDVLDLSSGLENAVWHANVSSLPTLRGGLGVVTVGECIYAIGGESQSAGPSGVTGATESFDARTGLWRDLSPLPTPRHGIGAAAVGHTIYVAAGGTQAFGYQPTAAQEALDVSGEEPCVSTSQDAPPPQNAATPQASSAAAPLIQHLAVRPQRLRLHEGRRGRRPSIVIVLSRAGRVLIRLPRRFRLDLSLKPGRNVLALPTHPNGDRLPQGRYHLRARPHPGHSKAQEVVARFRVVR